MKDGIDQAQALKIQTTTNGYTSWVFRQLAHRTQQSYADLAKSALDRWVAHESVYLAELGITQRRFLEVVEAGGENGGRGRRHTGPDVEPEPPVETG
ncbi:MAG TPA: hypothetical protein VEU30_11020 [Thermoanaerobaculia bacterium]|nr:hypothetical protein [Thermoanaerobaculia bacterium]